MDDGEDELTSALRAAWPHGVPGSELKMASHLSADMRKAVAARLRAVLLWKSGGGGKTGLQLAEAADVSRSRFYAMAQRFSKWPSIAALGGRVGGPRTGPARVDDHVRAAALSVIGASLRKDPGAGVAQILRRLAEEGVPPISKSMVRRLWLEAKRNAPPGRFGAELLFDSVGLDVASGGSRMRLHLVLDRGTGLILGSSQAVNRSDGSGIVRAANDAAMNLKRLDLTGFVAAEQGPDVVLSIQTNDDHVGRVLERRLSLARINCETEGKSVGSAAVDALGEKLDRFWLGVGERDDDISYRNGRKARMPEYTKELKAALTTAIEAHNGQRMKLARSGDTATVSAETMRMSVQRVLTVVAQAANELETVSSTPAVQREGWSPTRIVNDFGNG